MTNLSTVFPDKVVFLAPFVNVYPPTSDIWWRQKETLNAKQNKQTKWRRVQGQPKYRKLVVITNGSLPQVISSSAQPSYSNAHFSFGWYEKVCWLTFLCPLWRLTFLQQIPFLDSKSSVNKTHFEYSDPVQDEGTLHFFEEAKNKVLSCVTSDRLQN